MNRLLLARQRSMYSAPGGYAEKWAAARRFYEDDVASGFVRVQAELYAASFSNADLREQFLPRVGAWKQVVLEAVQEALSAYQPSLPPAFTAGGDRQSDLRVLAGDGVCATDRWRHQRRRAMTRRLMRSRRCWSHSSACRARSLQSHAQETSGDRAVAAARSTRSPPNARKRRSQS